MTDIFQVFSQILAHYNTHSVVLLQVVIGGINVDIIAKGKTKTLHVSLFSNKYIYMQYICIRLRYALQVIMKSDNACCFS